MVLLLLASTFFGTAAAAHRHHHHQKRQQHHPRGDHSSGFIIPNKRKKPNIMNSSPQTQISSIGSITSLHVSTSGTAGDIDSSVSNTHSASSLASGNQNLDHNYNINCNKELFSVAPMMAHTNRHYRFFWRLFSTHAFLYTEMIPAGQIVNAYDRELKRMRENKVGMGIIMEGIDKEKGVHFSNSREIMSVNADEILEVVHYLQSRDDEGKGNHINGRGNVESLNEMLRFAECSRPLKTIKGTETTAGTNINKYVHNRRGGPGPGQTTLQIGGSDPFLLAKASAIGSAFGYTCINLNCGCPSNAVSGRSGGASLMRDPMHVAMCVEAMNAAVTDIYHCHRHQDDFDSKEGFIDNMDTGMGINSGPTPISVKHRLGVREASTYDATEDRMKDDEEEAFPNCRDFVKAITFSGDVRTLQVHTRLGLLGDFDTTDESTTSSSSTLWVPGGASTPTSQSKSQSQPQPQQKDPLSTSIDHKRAQYQAKKRARKATIQNRSIPPLRPNVVNLLADEFPHLEFVANGGIDSMAAVQDRIQNGPSSVIGAMVGRAAINHPCSFALADSLWRDDDDDENNIDYLALPSRGDVLLDYIEYCVEEEQRVKAMGVNIASLAALRRRLVAVPFHLFVGEEGNDGYQRRIRRLVSRAERPARTAKSMLMAALFELPPESIQKSVGEFALIEDLKVHSYVERSGPLQKNIH